MKIQFGLSNVHVVGLKDESGTITYPEAPKAYPGAVKLSIDYDSEDSTEYADNKLWFSDSTVTKASPELEMEYLPDWFKEQYCGYDKADTGMLVYNTKKIKKHFALLYQVETDEKPIKYIMWNCVVSGKPSEEPSTNEAGKTIFHSTISMTASAIDLTDEISAIASDVPSTDSTYATLFTANLTLPTFTGSQAAGS